MTYEELEDYIEDLAGEPDDEAALEEFQKTLTNDGWAEQRIILLNRQRAPPSNRRDGFERVITRYRADIISPSVDKANATFLNVVRRALETFNDATQVDEFEIPTSREDDEAKFRDFGQAVEMVERRREELGGGIVRRIVESDRARRIDRRTNFTRRIKALRTEAAFESIGRGTALFAPIQARIDELLEIERRQIVEGERNR